MGSRRPERAQDGAEPGADGARGGARVAGAAPAGPPPAVPGVPPSGARAYRLGRTLCRLALRTLVRPEVVGLEHVPREGPLLVVGNHLSFLEPPLITAILPRRVTFLALYDLFAIRWLAPLLRLVGALPVKRGGARDLDAIRAALDLLRRGEAVGILPEGTRTWRPGLLRANPGVSLLATRSGAPVLPVAITGTERLTTVPGLLLARFRRRPVRVVIGRPFRPESGPGRADHQAIADRIMGEVAALLPAEYRGVYREGGD